MGFVMKIDRVNALPDDIDFRSPGRRDYQVCIEHPTLWGFFKIPLTVLVGPEAEEGRGVLAIGATHGDEYEGPLAIKNLLGEIDPARVLGRLLLVPVLNRPAFDAGVRDTPHDGINLNRAFPGNRSDSVTFQIARFVDRFLFPRVHVVLDIHSGGDVARLPYFAEFHAGLDSALRGEFEEASRGFGTRFVQIYQDRTPGLLTSRAEELGKITIGTELGWGGCVFPEGVACARRGILMAARDHNQLLLEEEIKPLHPESEQILVDTSDFSSSVLSPLVGHLEPYVELGARVEEGQPLAALHSFDAIDEPGIMLRSPHDGYVMCLSTRAPVFAGRVAALVGKEVPWLTRLADQRVERRS